MSIAEPADITLYSDKQTAVSPSWLINKSSRYAVRTIVRLEHGILKVPKGGARFFLFLGLGLLVMSARYVWAGAEPVIITIIMLLGSLLLTSGAAAYLLLKKPRYLIDVVLLDGAVISLTREKKDHAEQLLSALTRAMDWHRNTESLLESRNRHTRLHKGIAHGTRAGQASGGVPWFRSPARPENESATAVATRPGRVSRIFGQARGWSNARASNEIRNKAGNKAGILSGNKVPAEKVVANTPGPASGHAGKSAGLAGPVVPQASSRWRARAAAFVLTMIRRDRH